MNTPLILLLAWTIFREAEGEGLYGQTLVASVIYNRSRGEPARMAGVVTARKQFTCWNTVKDPAAWAKRKAARLGNRDFDSCFRLASELATGRFSPVTQATHYHALSVRPYWAKSMRLCTEHRNHKFYREFGK